MNNRSLGKIGSAVTGIATFCFALTMIIGLFTDFFFAGCFVCIFLAIGFVLFMAALNSSEDQMQKGCQIAAMSFASIYAVFIFIVYFAQCTTIRLNTHLSEEALSIISYSHLGSLFFNYDLLGYGFMALSTFLTGLSFKAENKGDHILRKLLMIHGVFFLCCLIVPMFPVFDESSASYITGVVLLEIWCAYFLPICLLGYKHFQGMKD